MSVMTMQSYHDCESIRPSMVVGTEDETVVSGFWPFRKKETIPRKIWERRQGTWLCPECKSEWEYRGNGWWTARSREVIYTKETFPSP